MVQRRGLALRGARRLAAVLIFIVLGGCAQDPNVVREHVGVGLIAVRPAPDYAALYEPYARMSSIAYTDRKFLDGNLCPRPKLMTVSPLNSDVQNARNAKNRVWVHELTHGPDRWSCLFGKIDPPCPKNRLGCRPLPGLEVHAWISRPRCEAVIAFRGTDFEQFGDWYSNFRSFRRLINEFDEYEQVKAYIAGYVGAAKNALRRQGCRVVRVTAAGHSLGGGLAQHAAYSDGRIRYVYAFNSSPVTGLFDIFPATAVRRQDGLGIDRVNSGGEILEPVRIVFGGFAQPQACRPRVRIVRFARLDIGGMIARHGIIDLSKQMADLAPTGHPRKVDGRAAALTCTAAEPGGGGAGQ